MMIEHGRQQQSVSQRRDQVLDLRSIWGDAWCKQDLKRLLVTAHNAPFTHPRSHSNQLHLDM